MENYNLTAELKKIASGITTSDPNTELGNINSGVGNLDTAMRGVATAINGISIPNPGSNIDGVATAIGNISIPNPGTNIDGVATAVDNLAGGKDLGDIETILTTMNGNIANLGSNHIIGINEAPAGATGYFVRYGNGTGTPLANEAEKTSYTDTNNIGATNVQGALDALSNKFYYKKNDNLSTNGTWGAYTNKYIEFDLPPSAYGAGKTFMIIHNVSWHNSSGETNIASKISLSGMAGTIYNELFNTRMFAGGWPSLNHISFVKCDANPRFEIGLSTNIAASGLYSTYILVPLN